MRSVARQNLPDQGAQAALRAIHFQHDPPGFFLLLLVRLRRYLPGGRFQYLTQITRNAGVRKY